jgi:hypothetical protein
MRIPSKLELDLNEINENLKQDSQHNEQAKGMTHKMPLVPALKSP